MYVQDAFENAIKGLTYGLNQNINRWGKALSKRIDELVLTAISSGYSKEETTNLLLGKLNHRTVVNLQAAKDLVVSKPLLITVSDDGSDIDALYYKTPNVLKKFIFNEIL